MIKVGITGGIGSGKSVICEIFRLHDIPAFDADKEAKALNDTSPEIREKLIHHFGSGIYEGSRLNRKKFASLIFNNKENLEIANAIIHPVVAEAFIKWCNGLQQHPIVIFETALLIEAGFRRLVDKVIVVQAPEELRLTRVMQRDKSSVSEAKSRMDNQMPQEQKVEFADFVINNDNRVSLIRQVANIMDTI